MNFDELTSATSYDVDVMERELETFKRRKRIEERNLQIKEKFENWWNRITSSLSEAVLPERVPLTDNISSSESSEISSNDEEDDQGEEKIKIKKKGKLTEPTTDSFLLDEHPNKWALIGLRLSKFLMWLLTFIALIKLGWGAPFFCVSALYFIWANTSTKRKRKRGQKSAYSVFNKDCEPITGTTTAKELEQQMLFGHLM